jgi:hypothetical protein
VYEGDGGEGVYEGRSTDSIMIYEVQCVSSRLSKVFITRHQTMLTLA